MGEEKKGMVVVVGDPEGSRDTELPRMSHMPRSLPFPSPK